MRYITFVLLVLFSFSLKAAASETIINVMEYLPEEEIDNNIPKCDDVLLIETTVKEIQKYLTEHNDGSIIEKRNRNLVLNYIDSYTEKNADDFDEKENYLVADTLIKLKINRHVRSENMRLCVSGGKKPVYLLVYPEDFRYNVEIINLSPKNITFLYTPPIKKYEDLSQTENEE